MSRRDSHSNHSPADDTQTGVFPTVEYVPSLKNSAQRTISSWGEFFHAVRNNSHTRSVVTSLILLCLGGAVGFGFMAQQRITDTSYSSLSESELVTLLSETDNQISRLETQRSQLNQQLQSIQSAADKQKEIERVVQENKDSNDILSGRVAATGEGVTITITQGSKKNISAAALYTVIEELRNAGAEVIQIGNVRVVTSTYIVDTESGLMSDGQYLSAPYEIKAIGDPSNLQNAVDINGGVGSSLRVNYGAKVTVTHNDKVEIKALANSFEYKYAKTVE
ncbi:DUF881 domain-containing protein [Alloscardovia omnicolens]|uniref:DUF881 domain-containing protein n=1 Tax=Alloscardovia omnicolens TaxID=419015 RepID=UPI003A7A0AD9